MFKLFVYVFVFFSFNHSLQAASSEGSHTHHFTKLSQKSFKKYKTLLENSTWIVPPNTLLSFRYDSQKVTPVSDQTVWVITHFEEGYFFGQSYAAIDTVPLSHTQFVGSITPAGQVYITFYPTTSALTSLDVITGIGKFVKIGKNYQFVMQMNTSQEDTSGLSHWSYMISVKPKDYLYQHLPSLNISVPQFLQLF